MGNIIQQIKVSADCSLFILAVNGNEIKFRSSRIPEQLKIAKIDRIEGEMVYFDNYHCHISYLEKFMAENAIE